MKRRTLSTFIPLLILCGASLRAQTTQNPILFVTQVPVPGDSLTALAAFGGHLGGPAAAPRGGDLWIRYADGTLKNLTQAAGYGGAGLQGANAIAVREPAVHWSGTKAIFSMVVGSPASVGDRTEYFWQIYEITGLGKDETPVITKIPNQPATFNNISPIYGTDERIIFTSDRPRTGEAHLYPQYDEYKMEPTIAGLYSLDRATGDLLLLDHAPSGDFSPIIDSYGRLLFIRWDHLQRDGVADRDMQAPGGIGRGTFNYADESASAAQLFGVRTEYFPEPLPNRTDPTTNVVGQEFNIFIPWQINEDGTEMETMNHVGRHELRQGFNRSINDDPQVTVFSAATSGRANTNSIVNLMQIAEDPTSPGTYYCVDAPQVGSHAAGQVVTIKGAPTLDPNQMLVGYITDRSTSNTVPPGQQPPPTHSGLYRNPLPTADGKLIAAHSAETHPDANTGTRANPASLYSFRLKTLKKSGNVWIPDQTLTSGITKSVSYYDPDVLVSYNGPLWEIYPVEVRARTKPARRSTSLGNVEQQVFAEEGVDEAIFRNYLKSKDLAVVISRNITHRDKADHQQPYYLRVAGSATQSPNATGKIYSVGHMNFFQGDQVRGIGKTSQNGAPLPGRRVIAQPMHDPNATNPADPSGGAGATKIAPDGSMAAFVPAHRAMTWQISDTAGKGIVRERYWVTFQPGELRTCTSCHGTNSGAASPINPTPTNKPQALRDLLRYWKDLVMPRATSLRSPANDTINAPLAGMLRWDAADGAASYRVQLATAADFASTLIDMNDVSGTEIPFTGLATGTDYFWRVQGSNSYGAGAWSPVWRFTTNAPPQPPSQAMLISPANSATGADTAGRLVWRRTAGASAYRVQLSTDNFTTFTVDEANVSDTARAFAGLAHGTIYQWRVQGSNAAGDGAWSESWSFTTANPTVQPPGTIALNSPVDGAMHQPASLSLAWSGASAAGSYRLQVATTSSFASPILDTMTALTQAALAGLADSTVYYWHVQGANQGGSGPWSETWSFTTAGKPVVISSADAVAGMGYRFEAFPNPASAQTYLRAVLPEGGNLSITVYDLLGNQVATIAEEHLEAGEHVYAYEPPAAGIYFCRMQSGSYTATSVVEITR